MTRKLRFLLLAALLGGTACSRETSDAEQSAPPAAAPAAPASPAAAPSDVDGGRQVPQAPARAVEPPPAQPAATGSTGPVAIYNPKPVFPRDMLEANIEGEVQVQFTVTTEGGVTALEVRSVTHQAFADALLDIMRTWRFQPAMTDGVPSERRVSLVVPFYIDNRHLQHVEALLDGSETQPLLSRFIRPANPKRLSGDVLLRVNISATSIVDDVTVLRNDAGADAEELRRIVRRWLFLPFRQDGNYVASEVQIGLHYAPGGSVLIQYPYPPPEPTAARQ